MPRIEPDLSFHTGSDIQEGQVRAKVHPSFVTGEMPPAVYPRYKSHKIIEAFKIAEVIPHPEWDKESVLVPENPELVAINVTDEYMAKHNPQVGGYYVRYPDGYESWSPAEAFEDGYTLIQAGDPLRNVAMAIMSHEDEKKGFVGTGDLVNFMNKLTCAERVSVIEHYCKSCGVLLAMKPRGICQCWNDE